MAKNPALDNGSKGGGPRITTLFDTRLPELLKFRIFLASVAKLNQFQNGHRECLQITDRTAKDAYDK